MLDRLREISERLANFYGWDEAQATVFVLTGITPLHRAMRAEARFSDPLPARSRITLTIDPKVTPREIADYYRAIRRDLFGGRRLRRLSAKHARLAVFAAQQPDDSTPAAQRARWNQECRAWKRPKWRYQETTRFKRDCQQALDRLEGL